MIKVLALIAGLLLLAVQAFPTATNVSANSDCPVLLTGDANQTGSLTSADIIYIINYIFRQGAEPLPCEAAADVNCDVAVTTSDIIHMVNAIFKGPAIPCDVCPLIEDGTWSCDAGP